MTRLSVKALRLYSTQGLLQPVYIDPSSGYRYYQLEQAYDAEVIRVLRSIDMPLPDIKRIVESQSDEALSERLQVHKTRLVERIAAQEAALGYLETMIRHKAVVSPYAVLLSQEPAQRVAAVKIHTSLSKIASDIQVGFGTLMQGLGQAGVAPIAAPMLVYHNVIDQESEGDIEVAVPVGVTFSAAGDVYARELEAGTVAATTHQGPYAGIVRAYHALTQWVSENGYEIAGPTREIYVNDPQVVASDHLLTRLEFPVCAQPSEV